MYVLNGNARKILDNKDIRVIRALVNKGSASIHNRVQDRYFQTSLIL